MMSETQHKEKSNWWAVSANTSKIYTVYCDEMEQLCVMAKINMVWFQTTKGFSPFKQNSSLISWLFGLVWTK